MLLQQNKSSEFCLKAWCTGHRCKHGIQGMSNGIKCMFILCACLKYALYIYKRERVWEGRKRHWHGISNGIKCMLNMHAFLSLVCKKRERVGRVGWDWHNSSWQDYLQSIRLISITTFFNRMQTSGFTSNVISNNTKNCKKSKK